MEPLLADDGPQRFTTFPVADKELWSMYKKAQACHWTAEEVDLARDAVDWETRLDDKQRHYIKHVLAFFAASDGIVVENLVTRFLQEVRQKEARAFYTLQAHMENVHGETYSLMIDALVKDSQEKAALFDAITTMKCVCDKGLWALRWIADESTTFADRLVAFAVVEGVFFSASFCAIYWLKHKNLMPGLAFANELIARDEGLHTDFACMLVHRLVHPPSPERILAIVSDAVAIEESFVTDALPVGQLGMNAAMMVDYVRFVADRLLLELGCEKPWYSANPFPWMELISLQGKSNFFEKRVSEYAKTGVCTSSDDDSLKQSRVFSVDEDF